MPKYQLSIGAIILSILVPLAITHAAYDDVTLTTDTVFTVGGYTLTVSGSSAVLESIEVNSSDFSVVVPANSTITVVSADRKVFTVDGVTSAYVTKTCSDTASTLVVVAPSGGGDGSPTALITPTATTCTTPSVGGSVSSGTGGGGGGGSPSTPSATPNPTIIPLVVVPTAPVSVTLTVDLSRGNEGADVTKLQAFLAKDKAIYPEGIVNGTFGPATERAVKRFQAKYGISQLGRVGPATREKIKVVSGATPATPAIPTVAPAIPAVPPTVVPGCPTGVVCTPTASAVFVKLLAKGMSSTDVINLQKILNKDPETAVSVSGVGSLGNESTTFGSLTEAAVQKFQVKYGIANPGDSGYGTVGPKTRAKLNELAK